MGKPETMDAGVLRQLARECLALGNRRLVCHQLGRRLAGLAPESGAALLVALHRWHDRSIPGVAELALALVDLDGLSEAMPPRGWEATLDQVELMGEGALAEVLRDALFGEAEKPLWLPESGDPPLGFRRWEARRIPRSRIERLLREETHPVVIQSLLEHPQITEREVVLLCARPEMPSAVLVTIARHERWGTRYDVVRALVAHPAAPVRICLLLLPLLHWEDLAEVAADPRLSPLCRLRAKELYQLRRVGRGQVAHLLHEAEP